MLLQQYWAKEAGPYRFIPAAEMAEAFQNSSAGRAAAEELAQPPERTQQGVQSLPRSGRGLGGPQLDVVLSVFKCLVPGQRQGRCGFYSHSHLLTPLIDTTECQLYRAFQVVETPLLLCLQSPVHAGRVLVLLHGSAGECGWRSG